MSKFSLDRKPPGLTVRHQGRNMATFRATTRAKFGQSRSNTMYLLDTNVI